MGGVSFRDVVRSQFLKLPVPDQDFTGQTVIVTGASRGLGLNAAGHFVRLNAATVILAVRDTKLGQECKSGIQQAHPSSKTAIEVWDLNLNKVDSIKQFVAKANGLVRLDAVVLNAGVATMSFDLVDGVEKTTLTNIVGTMLLAIGLLPALRNSAAQHNTHPRLVLVSSESHTEAYFKEANSSDLWEALNDPKSDMTDRYNVTKLMQLYLFRALKEEAEKIQPGAVIFTAVDPGLCDTSLTREMPLIIRILHRGMRMVLARPPEVGSRVLVLGAADNGVEYNGAYLKDCALGQPGEIVTSQQGVEHQKRVWTELLPVLSRMEPELVGSGLPANN